MRGKWRRDTGDDVARMLFVVGRYCLDVSPHVRMDNSTSLIAMC